MKALQQPLEANLASLTASYEAAQASKAGTAFSIQEACQAAKAASACNYEGVPPLLPQLLESIHTYIINAASLTLSQLPHSPPKLLELQKLQKYFHIKTKKAAKVLKSGLNGFPSFRSCPSCPRPPFTPHKNVTDLASSQYKEKYVNLKAEPAAQAAQGDTQ